MMLIRVLEESKGLSEGTILALIITRYYQYQEKGILFIITTLLLFFRLTPLIMPPG
jgi:hypothetical protein